MSLNVLITDRKHRDRLHHGLLRMREQIVSLSEGGSGVKANPGWSAHRAAILKSARANVRDLAAAIKDWDRKHRPRKRRRGAKAGGA